MTAKVERDKAMRAAIERHRAGRLEEARALLEEIISADPRSDEAHHRLGLIRYARGDIAGAIEMIGAAAKIAPLVAEYRNSLGLARRIAGQAQAAVECYRQAIELKPAVPQFHYNLANALREQGETEAAVASYRRAIVLDPAFAEAHNNLGSALNQLGQIREAVAAYRAAIHHDATLAVAHHNLGNVLQAIGRFREAIEHLRLAGRLMPAAPGARIKLGDLFDRLGAHRDAVAQYTYVLACAPDNVGAMLDMGDALARRGATDEALAWFRLAATIDPQSARGLQRAADLLIASGDSEAGTALLERAFGIGRNAQIGLKLAQVAPVVPPDGPSIAAARAGGIAWLDRLPQRIRRAAAPGDALAGLAPGLINGNCDDRMFHARIAEAHHQACPAFTFVAPPAGRARSSRSAKKLRLGVVVPNRIDTTLDRLYVDLVAELPRDVIRLIGLFLAPPIGAGARAVRARCDLITVLPDTFEAARMAVAESELDALLFIDVVNDHFAYGLALARLAPLQAVLWSHPVTTGIATMDLFLSARGFEPEAAQRRYVERLVELEQPPVFARRREPGGRDRHALGLPDQVHVYACLNSLPALHPDFDRSLVAILDEDPRALIVLQSDAHGALAAKLKARLTHRSPKAADRLRFMPQLDAASRLDLLAVADVVLAPQTVDCLPLAYDALAVAAPIVCQAGEQLRGRAAYGLLRLLEVDDGIAEDGADYVHRAVRLARESRRRARYRDRLAAAAPRLFENRQGVTLVTDALARAAAQSAGTAATG